MTHTETMKAEVKHAIHFEGRRWFQRTYGNTYHTARVFINGELRYQSGRHYGYGDQWIESATAMLVGTEFVPEGFKATQSTLVIREGLGASYSVIDVERQKDL